RTFHAHITPRFPYTTLFRSFQIKRQLRKEHRQCVDRESFFLFNVHTSRLILQPLTSNTSTLQQADDRVTHQGYGFTRLTNRSKRSEEHTSELQSRFDIVCRL